MQTLQGKALGSHVIVLVEISCLILVRPQVAKNVYVYCLCRKSEMLNNREKLL